MPTYAEQLEVAHALPNSELEHHARVAAMENGVRCKLCFCCAAEEVLLDRKSRGADLAVRLARKRGALGVPTIVLIGETTDDFTAAPWDVLEPLESYGTVAEAQRAMRSYAAPSVRPT